MGVIGLGQIGRGVALSLARRGRRLSVYDVRADAADGLSGVPALADSARAVAAASPVIFVCVVDAAQIRSLLESPDGILAGCRPGAVLIVMSTISLPDLRSLSELADAHQVTMLDAGVTGGPAAAAAGQLAVFLGGDDQVVASVLPVVQDCSAMVVRSGGPGTGMAAKIARNIVAYGSFRAAYEGGLVAERCGVDLHAFAAAIRRSESQYGGCTVFLDRRGTVGPIPVGDADARDAATHLARLAGKDLAAAADLAWDLGIELPLATCAGEKYYEVLGLAPE